jgi:valyl-tRNA synthetase
VHQNYYVFVDCTKPVVLKEYLFGPLTTALFNFWLYDFCDVYLELVKPVMNDLSPENAERRFAAQCTLAICVEAGLRLLHPLMPFVTEELWQRLPGKQHMRSPPPDTIMLAEYPTDNLDWMDPRLEEEVALVKDVVHAARSLRADYNLTNNVKPVFVLRCRADAQGILQEQVGTNIQKCVLRVSCIFRTDAGHHDLG